MTQSTMAFSEQAVLWALLDLACGIWAAALAWQAWGGGSRHSLRHQAGQRWRAASAVWAAAALLGHAARITLREELADPARCGDWLPDTLALLFCALLLVGPQLQLGGAASAAMLLPGTAH